MPLENRVDPWGRIHAVAARGTLLGNRGRLHDEIRQLTRQWDRKAWVTCELEHDGRKRDVFGPNSYSELFFLDEATAFSAGHRPCASCRRARYLEFRSKWMDANGAAFSLPDASMSEVDKLLHAERVTRAGTKTTFERPLADLSFGTFIDVEGEALLVWRPGLMQWSFTGYSPYRRKLSPSTAVRLLTPESIVRTFSAGFLPTVHPSAGT